MLLHNIFITSKSNSIYIFKNTKKRETIINFIDRISNKNRYLQQKIEAILIAVANLIYD